MRIWNLYLAVLKIKLLTCVFFFKLKIRVGCARAAGKNRNAGNNRMYVCIGWGTVISDLGQRFPRRHRETHRPEHSGSPCTRDGTDIIYIARTGLCVPPVSHTPHPFTAQRSGGAHYWGILKTYPEGDQLSSRAVYWHPGVSALLLVVGAHHAYCNHGLHTLTRDVEDIGSASCVQVNIWWELPISIAQSPLVSEY